MDSHPFGFEGAREGRESPRESAEEGDSPGECELALLTAVQLLYANGTSLWTDQEMHKMPSKDGRCKKPRQQI